MHAGFGHLPAFNAAGLPTSMGIHPTPLSALTAAARSPSMPPALQGPGGPGGLGGGPLRRRISDKSGGPLPISNGMKKPREELNFFQTHNFSLSLKILIQNYIIDKSVLGLLVAGIPYMFDRAGLDIAQGKKIFL